MQTLAFFLSLSLLVFLLRIHVLSLSLSSSLLQCCFWYRWCCLLFAIGWKLFRELSVFTAFVCVVRLYALIVHRFPPLRFVARRFWECATWMCFLFNFDASVGAYMLFLQSICSKINSIWKLLQFFFRCFSVIVIVQN